MKLSIFLIAVLFGLAQTNTYIKTNYKPLTGPATAFTSAQWNQKFKSEYLYTVKNDNDPKITLGVDRTYAGAVINQRRFDPRKPSSKDLWIITTAKGGNGYNIHSYENPNYVWTRPNNWYTNNVGDISVRLQQLDDDNENQVWAWKLGGQMWAYDFKSTTTWTKRMVGYLDVVHCNGGQTKDLVIRRETNAKQQIWHWETLNNFKCPGLRCCVSPPCKPPGIEVNLVEMKNWVFKEGKGVSAVVKEFKCENLNDARSYARLYIKNQGKMQTLVTWYKDQGRLTIREVRDKKSQRGGPRQPLPAPNVYTFAEGIQIAYKNSNFFIFLQSVLARGKNTISVSQLRQVTEHVWKLNNKHCWTTSTGKRNPKDTITAEDARDFTVAAMQATNTPVVEHAIDKAFNVLIKANKSINCNQMIDILKKLAPKWKK